MAISLTDMFIAVIMVINAMAILNKERFLNKSTHASSVLTPARARTR